MGKINSKYVDVRGSTIPKLKDWKVKNPDSLYFDSMFEWKVYKLLEASELPFIIKPEKMILQHSFESYTLDYTQTLKKKQRSHMLEGSTKSERTSNKRKFNKEHNKSIVPLKIQPITWAPDFVLPNHNIIIEAKGFPNESFPLKLKLARMIAMEEGLIIIVVSTQKEVNDLIKDVKTNWNK